MPQSKYWNMAGQAVAIVASILLAFAIQAWWELRGERAEMDAMLAALGDEFVAVQAELDRSGLVQAAAGDAQMDWITLMSPNPTAEDVGQLLTIPNNPARWTTADLPTGALQSLLADGALARITNIELRVRLADWPSKIADLETGEAGLASELNGVFQRAATLSSYPFLSLEFVAGQPERFPVDGVALLSDAELSNRLKLAILLTRNGLRKKTELSQEADTLIRLIDAALGR